MELDKLVLLLSVSDLYELRKFLCLPADDKIVMSSSPVRGDNEGDNRSSRSSSSSSSSSDSGSSSSGTTKLVFLHMKHHDYIHIFLGSFTVNLNIYLLFSPFLI